MGFVLKMMDFIDLLVGTQPEGSCRRRPPHGSERRDAVRSFHQLLRLPTAEPRVEPTTGARFCAKNDEICAKNDGFCTENDGLSTQKFAKIWDVLLVFFLLYVACVIPARIAFDTKVQFSTKNDGFYTKYDGFSTKIVGFCIRNDVFCI